MFAHSKLIIILHNIWAPDPQDCSISPTTAIKKLRLSMTKAVVPNKQKQFQQCKPNL